MVFPQQRLRRTRRTTGLRGLVRETELSPKDFIYPIFVAAGEDVRNPISSMPNIFQLSINHAVEEATRAHELGILGVMLFGIPHEKDEAASGAYDPEGIVQLATRAIKDALPELLVATDVCLCEYTSHGHCGASSTARALRRSRSWPTPRSTPPPSTGRSARPPRAPRSLETGAATRWTLRTPARRCARSR